MTSLPSNSAMRRCMCSAYLVDGGLNLRCGRAVRDVLRPCSCTTVKKSQRQSPRPSPRPSPRRHHARAHVRADAGFYVQAQAGAHARAHAGAHGRAHARVHVRSHAGAARGELQPLRLFRSDSPNEKGGEKMIILDFARCRSGCGRAGRSIEEIEENKN